MAINVYQDILANVQAHKKMLAVLIDPEKCTHPEKLCLEGPDYIFVGGSTGHFSNDFIEKIRHYTHRPIVLFPGNIHQFSSQADALLFLSLLSCRNADLLIGEQIKIARQVKESGIESIPMGYILVDGGRESSTLLATLTQPLNKDHIAEIVDTAIVAELLGKKLIYLEAGSGAMYPIAEETIRQVKQHISIPLIVGGGICTISQMRRAYDAGADLVVIGNHFEKNPDEIEQFCHERG